MPYIGGTPEVQHFIKKYKASGHLIDPYSREWLASLEVRRNSDSNFYSDIDDDQYAQYETEFGSEFWNHLLILYVDQSNSGLIRDLKTLYEPFKYIFEDCNSLSGLENHRPDFILINLHVRKAICIGLGRKNRLFVYDLDEYSNNVSNVVNSLKYNGVGYIENNIYYKDFVRFDHARFLDSMVQGLYELGRGLFLMASTPGNPDEWPDRPNEDGMYILEDGEFTSEEFEGVKSDYYEADELISGGVSDINLFFPKVEDGDLNTGDY